MAETTAWAPTAQSLSFNCSHTPPAPRYHQAHPLHAGRVDLSRVTGRRSLLASYGPAGRGAGPPWHRSGLATAWKAKG